MPRWKEPLAKYHRHLWQAAFALMLLGCLALAADVWLAARQEAKDAFESGRRLILMVENGEVKGKILALDGTPVAAAPEPQPQPSETPPAEAPVAEPPTESSPVSEPVVESAPEDAPSPKPEIGVIPPQPATPMPDVDPALVEHTGDGDLPVIGSDGTKPWRAYAKPFERKRNQPMVAVIVSGLGLNREVTQNALHLHEYFSVSFSPYARDIASWRSAVRAKGHEMLIDLPLQPTDYPLSDPGPQSLLLEKGDVNALQHMQWMMARFPTTIGFVTPQNESFTANDEALKMLLQTLANRGLILVMGREPHKKETKELVDASHTASAIADILVDEEQSAAAIQARLTQLEERAKKHGYAIGIAQAYPITLSQLHAWSQTLAEKGILLVPVSAIVKLRFS